MSFIQNKSKATAILLTGQIRVNTDRQYKNWIILKKILRKYDVYVATYDQYYSLANQVTSCDKILVVDSLIKSEITRQRDEFNIISRRCGFLQLIQIEMLINKFNNELKNYDCLVRIRSDLSYDTFQFNEYVNRLCELSHQNKFHLRWDYMYSGLSESWIKLAEKKKIISEIGCKDNFLRVPVNYDFLHKTIIQQKNFFYDKLDINSNLVNRWINLIHNIDDIIEVNNELNFVQTDIKVDNNHEFKTFAPSSLHFKKNQTIFDAKKYPSFLSCRDNKIKIWNFALSLAELCKNRKSSEKKINKGGCLLFPPRCNPELGLLKWFLNTGTISGEIEGYKINLVR